MVFSVLMQEDMIGKKDVVRMIPRTHGGMWTFPLQTAGEPDSALRPEFQLERRELEQTQLEHKGPQACSHTASIDGWCVESTPKMPPAILANCDAGIQDKSDHVGGR